MDIFLFRFANMLFILCTILSPVFYSGSYFCSQLYSRFRRLLWYEYDFWTKARIWASATDTSPMRVLVHISIMFQRLTGNVWFLTVIGNDRLTLATQLFTWLKEWLPILVRVLALFSTRNYSSMFVLKLKCREYYLFNCHMKIMYISCTNTATKNTNDKRLGKVRYDSKESFESNMKKMIAYINS